MSTQIKTLGDALPEEIKRCQDLLVEYAAIGPNGRFGSAMIKSKIDLALTAMAQGDLVAMLRAHNDLKECK
jgi:hypothetical protein